MGTDRQTALPAVLALLYALAIVYASLQPFTPWIWPAPDTRFFLWSGWPAYWTRYDVALNIIAYAPFGFFMGWLPRNARPWKRIALALLAGAALSFAMETLQMTLPPRDASVLDLCANSIGALLGGMLASAVADHAAAHQALHDIRHRLFLAGRIGDVGIALLAVWLVAQLNPGIPLFAVTYASGTTRAFGAAQASVDGATLLIDAAGSAFQLLGVGLFLALLLRQRADAGGAVLLLVGAALSCKGVAALIMLKPAVWQTWMRPGVLMGIAAGSLLMPVAIGLPRPAQIALCAILLLASIGTPLLTAELLVARAPAALFDWRYGQLLNFNGLTRATLLVWPIFAAIWLFALAGRPGWGRPDPVA